MPKKFYRRIFLLQKNHFRIFQKNGISEFFNILLNVSFRPSKIMHKKKLGYHASFPTIRGDRPFWSEFRTRISS
jgi:hypothetical protein